MAVFRINVKNEFHENGRELVVFSSSEKRNHLVNVGEGSGFDIPEVPQGEPEDYLLISMPPGAGRLLGIKVKLPLAAELTFMPAERVDTSISRDDFGTYLKIPEVPSTWQLKITSPATRESSSSTPYSTGPDNVSVGEDGQGG